MKVKALETGFYAGGRVRAGTVFDVPEGTKGKWFVPVAEVKADAKADAKAKGKAEKAPATLSEAGKEQPADFNESMA